MQFWLHMCCSRSWALRFLLRDNKPYPHTDLDLEVASLVQSCTCVCSLKRACVCVCVCVYLYRCWSTASRVDLFVFGKLSMKVEYFLTRCLSSASSAKPHAWGRLVNMTRMTRKGNEDHAVLFQKCANYKIKTPHAPRADTQYGYSSLVSSASSAWDKKLFRVSVTSSSWCSFSLSFTLRASRVNSSRSRATRPGSPGLW